MQFPITDRSKETARFALFIDQLFDSLNGSSFYDARKPLKNVVKVDSATSHVDFWKEALIKIRSFKSSSAHGKHITLN